MRSRWLALCLLTAAVAAQPTVSHACGWSWETYAAEGKHLPCVHDVLTGHFATHTDEYHDTLVEATDWALAWAPGWTAALDAKGLALMHRGKLELAKVVMQRRLAIAPDAYASHSNLGTLYTFTGDFPQALEHIDRAMKIEPKAHFGRELYHRELVELLAERRANPNAAHDRNFLGFGMTVDDQMQGSDEQFVKLGIREDVFDALTSMVAVYGAEQLAEMYLTFGNVLAAKGYPKLAYTAYRRALEIGYPERQADLEAWTRRLRVEITQRSKTRRDAEAHRRRGGAGGYRGIEAMIANRRDQARGARSNYHNWEKTQVRRGLAIWTRDGVSKVYEKMDQVRLRCQVGKLLRGDDPAPPEAPNGK